MVAYWPLTSALLNAPRLGLCLDKCVRTSTDTYLVRSIARASSALMHLANFWLIAHSKKRGNNGGVPNLLVSRLSMAISNLTLRFFVLSVVEDTEYAVIVWSGILCPTFDAHKHLLTTKIYRIHLTTTQPVVERVAEQTE